MKKKLRKPDIDNLAYDDNGLIPIIIQDILSKDILALYRCDKASLLKTLETGKIHYWDKKTGKPHMKGSTSGTIMEVDSILVNEDHAALLAKVRLQGIMKVGQNGDYTTFGMEKPEGDFMDDLFNFLANRMDERPEGSYTVTLLNHERKRLKKLMESSTDTIIDAANHDRERIIYDAANVIYHLIIILLAEDIKLMDLKAELQRRR